VRTDERGRDPEVGERRRGPRRGAPTADADRVAVDPVAHAAAPVPVPGWTELGLGLMVFIWALNFSVVKRTLEVMEPLGFNALRFLIASVFVYVVLRVRGGLRRPEPSDVRRLVVLGVVGNVLYQVAFIFGVDLTRAGNASVMLALTPLFVVLLSWRAGHEQPGPFTLVGGASSVVGVALVSGAALHLGSTLRGLAGDLILVGAALVWAVYTVGSRPLIEKYGSVQTTAWTLWSGGAVLAMVGTPALIRQSWSAVTPAAWAGLVYSSVFAIGLSYLLWYRGVERLGNTRTSIFSNLTPAVALLIAALWLGERLTLLSLVGATMTIAGVMLVRWDHLPARAADLLAVSPETEPETGRGRTP
jgi:drug/metabolite transporter (DMT)-like permease